MFQNSESSECHSKSSGLDNKQGDHKIQENSSQSENDSIEKKVKLNDERGQIKISRKMSDDLIKIFERLPNDQISKLLDVIKVKNSRITLTQFYFIADLPVQVNLDDLMSKEDDFVLDSQSDSQNGKLRKRRESKEKECKCCKQLVKRHHCTHTECEKPCQFLEKIKKGKP
ncbi:unnamed protein product (macronuclear) [Paramecium tetraurelia]|uniref:Uncharacterized protein n=1 Tax=Paramecium tetraurelia TaxID=5888 RepID=A0BXX6_PARTE|nr:uncharacterized protein GSPATT00033246001 [Paramecium tetraurelia]CAK63393.1 unnamed protein product [Paramecium tetraurelia]|eukprot:XP_001430791.1 hypothetical protein (macronuclear) [Paramecium tetraurelia strain d4-2]